MKIATYNVNGIGARLPRLLEWLDETQPDIVCLQELKAPDERFPEAEIAAHGYNAVWHGQKSWNGVAILARGLDLHETRKGLPNDPDPSHSRYIEAAVGGIIVGGLYLPNGNPRARPQIRLQDRLVRGPARPTPPPCSRPRRQWCWPATGT